MSVGGSYVCTSYIFFDDCVKQEATMSWSFGTFSVLFYIGESCWEALLLPLFPITVERNLRVCAIPSSIVWRQNHQRTGLTILSKKQNIKELKLKNTGSYNSFLLPFCVTFPRIETGACRQFSSGPQFHQFLELLPEPHKNQNNNNNFRQPNHAPFSPTHQ